ncbi:hypothetical protein CPE01_17820 [Cellulomonas persica]|uniref:Uncharacterized protein n=1 Tax=Cellulomonas persica TaxID=76861 RepID=A0A510UU04_9CELL|nr:hypothetical protein CPE01_17820 [Cellulomonas persica]
MVPLGLELGDDDDRQDDVVLREAVDRPWVGQEHGGVQDVGPPALVDRDLLIGLRPGDLRRDGPGVGRSLPSCAADHGVLPPALGAPQKASRAGDPRGDHVPARGDGTGAAGP